MQDLSSSVICIVGPTASGKSDLALRLALALGGEVVGADSMQIYRGMDIGTGKIPRQERKVAHFGIDLVEPNEPYSAALYQDYARSCFSDIDRRNKRAILVGGTGFYVRAAIDDYDFAPGDQVNNSVREQCQQFACDNGDIALWNKLCEYDNESAQIIHPHNVRRVARAFELLAQGSSYAEQAEKLARIKQYVPAVFIGLSVDPSVLNKRIDERVDAMFKQGLVDEVKGLLDKGFRDALTASQAIGYKETVAYIDGMISLEEAADQIKTATHRYAKRQRSWFRKDDRIFWINAEDDEDAVFRTALSLIDDASSPATSDKTC